MEPLDIGEVARRSGMAASTLRYYEAEGLITSTARRGLRRQFPGEVLETLAVVAICQQAGFTLAEVKALLATGGDATWKDLAATKRDELRDQARRLAAIADHLDHAVACPSPKLLDCENFRAELAAALPVTDRAAHRSGAARPPDASPDEPEAPRTASAAAHPMAEAPRGRRVRSADGSRGV